MTDLVGQISLKAEQTVVASQLLDKRYKNYLFHPSAKVSFIYKQGFH